MVQQADGASEDVKDLRNITCISSCTSTIRCYASRIAIYSYHSHSTGPLSLSSWHGRMRVAMLWLLGSSEMLIRNQRY